MHPKSIPNKNYTFLEENQSYNNRKAYEALCTHYISSLHLHLESLMIFLSSLSILLANSVLMNNMAFNQPINWKEPQ